jgi:hypothetical protein
VEIVEEGVVGSAAGGAARPGARSVILLSTFSCAMIDAR